MKGCSLSEGPSHKGRRQSCKGKMKSGKSMLLSSRVGAQSPLASSPMLTITSTGIQNKSRVDILRQTMIRTTTRVGRKATEELKFLPRSVVLEYTFHTRPRHGAFITEVQQPLNSTWLFHFLPTLHGNSLESSKHMGQMCGLHCHTRCPH